MDDIVAPGWLVVVKTNPRDLFNVPTGNAIDDDGVHDPMVDTEPYQQLVVDLNVYRASPTQLDDIIIDLYGEDEQTQTLAQGESSQIHQNNAINTSFSDEEDLLDDFDSDTEAESDTNIEIEEIDESEDIDESDSATEDSNE